MHTHAQNSKSHCSGLLWTNQFIDSNQRMKMFVLWTIQCVFDTHRRWWGEEKISWKYLKISKSPSFVVIQTSLRSNTEWFCRYISMPTRTSGKLPKLSLSVCRTFFSSVLLCTTDDKLPISCWWVRSILIRQWLRIFHFSQFLSEG